MNESSQGRRPRLNVGLIGCGRLGRVYARDLSSRIAETRLTAVADANMQLAAAIADEFDAARSYGSARELLADPGIDAAVIVSPTHTHRDVVLAAAEQGKPVFCEKPLALSLAECREMKDAVERAGIFFQMGFMRRFDPAYAAGKAQIDEGRIGTPVVFKSTSRDPYRPSLEYANPASSGGIPCVRSWFLKPLTKSSGGNRSAGRLWSPRRSRTVLLYWLCVSRRRN